MAFFISLGIMDVLGGTFNQFLDASSLGLFSGSVEIGCHLRTIQMLQLIERGLEKTDDVVFGHLSLFEVLDDQVAVVD